MKLLSIFKKYLASTKVPSSTQVDPYSLKARDRIRVITYNGKQEYDRTGVVMKKAGEGLFGGIDVLFDGDDRPATLIMHPSAFDPKFYREWFLLHRPDYVDSKIDKADQDD